MFRVDELVAVLLTKIANIKVTNFVTARIDGNLAQAALTSVK